jgi:hypothetical protein
MGGKYVYNFYCPTIVHRRDETLPDLNGPEIEEH